MDENFQVIKSVTKLAIVDELILKDIASGHFNWKKLQTHSVQIAEYKLNELHAAQIADGIYRWDFGYDDFIGYMRGVIANRVFLEGVLVI